MEIMVRVGDQPAFAYICSNKKTWSMTQPEREQLERDLALYLWLLDYYARKRNRAKSMTDKEYTEYIDAILDEINCIREILEKHKDKP